MHELSIAHSLVRLVGEALEPCRDATVLAVRLRIGALAGVAPEALRFCYDIATQGTGLEGSRLEIDEVPLAIRCPTCDRSVEPTDPSRFRCPLCDTPSAEILRGRELEIESIELADDAV
jgi:hydrogenase nickel incorporation protein HypA/HybF